MAKLTYVNRKTEGTQLGKIVARDIRKRFQPADSSEKPSNKHVEHLDLLLNRKCLTDEGLAEIVTALKEVVGVNATGSGVKIQVLNLKGNVLTMQSLCELAPVLQATASHLKELDLSENILFVTDEQEASQFKTFLESLANAKVLNLLHLGNNGLCGLRSFEVFAQVYAKQINANQSALEKIADFGSGVLVFKEGFANLNETPESDPKDGNAAHNSIPRLDISLTGLQGLPSIRTVNLIDCSLTEAGALFLSYCVQMHRWISERLNYPYFPQSSEEAENAGIIPLPNVAMSAYAERMLKLSEIVPYQAFDIQLEAFYDAFDGKGTDTPNFQAKVCGQASFRSSELLLNLPARGDVEKPYSSFQAHSDAEELDGLRKKLQRKVLEEKGTEYAILWSTALKLLSLSRKVLLGESFSQTVTPSVASSVRKPSDMHSGKLVEAEIKHTNPLGWRINMSNSRDGGYRDIFANSLGVWQLDPAHPAYQRSNALKMGQSGDARSHSEMSCPSTPGIGFSKPAALMYPFQTEPSTEDTVKGLPVKAWGMVLIDVLGCPKVLSDNQIKNVIAWACDRNTLAYEREALGKPRAIQIWRVLHGMGCLTFEVKGW